MILVLSVSLLAGCHDEGDDDGGSAAGTAEPALSLREVARDRLEFRDFDTADPLSSTTVVTIDRARFYRGELSTFDQLKTEVHVVLNPSGAVERTLIVVSGGTGTDPRHALGSPRNHKALVVLSQRGLHPDDLMNECPLGARLVDCLRSTPDLADFNPDSNGRDLVDLVNVLASQSTVALTVDGTRRDARSFLGDALRTNDMKFNIETASYGATILAYALQRGLPSRYLGRIFISGPSSPSELVITDGFRNGRVVVGNFMEAISMSMSEQTQFLNLLRARHTAPSALPVTSPNYDADDSLSSAHIFTYMLARYDEIGAVTADAAQTTMNITALREQLLAVADGSADAAARMAISSSDLLTALEQGQIRWEWHILDIRAAIDGDPTDDVFDGLRIFGFTQRIAQICSAYINRRGGDSQARFDAALADGDNDPYWYGFLITYRQLLGICVEIRINTRSDLTVPDVDDVDAEALLQYGAGLDEKHHVEDLMEMESYFSDATVKEMVYVDNQLQGGSGPYHRNCFDRFVVAGFETTPVNTVANAVDAVRSTHCGISE